MNDTFSYPVPLAHFREVGEVSGRGMPPMTTRTTTATATFRGPFLLNGTDHVSPAGDYRVVTNEELIEGLSFLAYRRVMTAIFLPGAERGSWEMHVIDPEDLAAAQERDREGSSP
jgi:hypothetical protein